MGSSWLHPFHAKVKISLWVVIFVLFIIEIVAEIVKITGNSFDASSSGKGSAVWPSLHDHFSHGVAWCGTACTLYVLFPNFWPWLRRGHTVHGDFTIMFHCSCYASLSLSLQSPFATWPVFDFWLGIQNTSKYYMCFWSSETVDMGCLRIESSLSSSLHPLKLPCRGMPHRTSHDKPTCFSEHCHVWEADHLRWWSHPQGAAQSSPEAAIWRLLASLANCEDGPNFDIYVIIIYIIYIYNNIWILLW